ncbi:MAG: PilZ domain-containing protein [Candidatus Omnitrophica bacterium]|nr:PilZ domain-containing protein [Candidatus Omnitrophota bacterium]
MQKKERRRFIRIPAYHLAKYRLFSESSPQSKFILATLKDIGAGGVCLRTKEVLPVSSVIELKINFPSVNMPISILAKVIWMKKIARSGYYDVGTEFLQIEESTHNIINQHAKFLHKKLRAT